MRTVRRLYFYAVALVSLEIILWGLVNLARSMVTTSDVVTGSADRLAQALALILVGVPVFGFHWGMSQRFAAKEMEERSSGVRAVFLYAVLLGTLIPIVQNLLSLLDRLVLRFAGLSASQAFLGPNQTWTDNLIAILMNAIVAAYFFHILRGDWQVITSRDALIDVRRLYHHIWLLYSLAILIAAVQQLLRYILNVSPDISGYLFRGNGAHGMVLAVVGVPLWVWAWKNIRDSLIEQAERESLLRLGVLYFLSLAGVITVLATSGIFLDIALLGLFGENMTLVRFIQRVSIPVSLGVPLAGVWAYYGGWLTKAISESPDAPRRAGMRRLYFYILAAIGLAATFTGLSLLVAFIVDAVVSNLVWADNLRPHLAAALSTLIAGLPLWLLTWRPMQKDALMAGEIGDHARRSLVRRIFLYVALFASVVGGMVAAALLVYNLLRALLGQTPAGFLQSVLKESSVLVLFILMGIYHGLTLGADNKRASEALAEKHAAFPVLIFDPGDGIFAQFVLAALQKQAPRLPASIHPASQPVAEDAVPKAVILPADMALNPSESLRRWLDEFSGNRLVVPYSTESGKPESWVWAGGTRPLPAMANAAALAVRQLAEGQMVRPQAGTSGWMVFLYVIAGFFGLEVLIALISLVTSLFRY